MYAPRISSCCSTFFNKYYQFLPVFRTIEVKKWCLTPSSFFSSFCQKSLESNKLTLTPLNPLVESSRGLKLKAQLQLRCKDCYYVRKEGMWYVMCSSYARHKQRQRITDRKYKWILTYAMQSKQRPW